MKHLLRSHNFYVILLADVAMIIASLLLAYSVRFEFRISEREWQGFLHVLPIVLAVKLSAFFLFHLYRGMWRYTSLVDLLNVIKASIASTLFINFAILALYRFQGFSRSVFMIDWALTLISIGGIRLGVRLFFARKLFNEIFPSFTPLNDSRKNVLIIGAGNAGEQIVREMLDSPAWRIAPSGFLDDHPDKQGKAIHGVSVLGTISELNENISSGVAKSILFLKQKVVAKESCQTPSRCLTAMKSSRLQKSLLRALLRRDRGGAPFHFPANSSPNRAARLPRLASRTRDARWKARLARFAPLKESSCPAY